MTELDLYKKMYSTLVAQADQILQELASTLTSQNCGWKELNLFGTKLKQALLDAEEIYLYADDPEEEEEETL